MDHQPVIPTLDEVGVIAMIALFAAVTLVYLWRRRRA